MMILTGLDLLSVLSCLQIACILVIPKHHGGLVAASSLYVAVAEAKALSAAAISPLECNPVDNALHLTCSAPEPHLNLHRLPSF